MRQWLNEHKMATLGLGQVALNVLRAADRLWLPPRARHRVCELSFYEDVVRRIDPGLPHVSLGAVLGLSPIPSDYGNRP